jgi:hypothetical protein
MNTDGNQKDISEISAIRGRIELPGLSSNRKLHHEGTKAQRTDSVRLTGFVLCIFVSLWFTDLVRGLWLRRNQTLGRDLACRAVALAKAGRALQRDAAPRHARGPDPFDSAQGHPEPVERGACRTRRTGEPVERASLRPHGTFLFPRRGEPRIATRCSKCLARLRRNRMERQDLFYHGWHG